MSDKYDDFKSEQFGSLCVGLKPGQSVYIGDVQVQLIEGMEHSRIRIVAPRSVKILREKFYKPADPSNV